MHVSIPWFVLLVSAFNKTQPFLEITYSTVIICLYTVSMGAWQLVSKTDEWKSKLAATQSQDKLMQFQVAELAVMFPTNFVSVYLLFDSFIPVQLFYVCMLVAVFGRQIVKWMWEKQLHRLTLS
jgi:hypothetical protein